MAVGFLLAGCAAPAPGPVGTSTASSTVTDSGTVGGTASATALGAVRLPDLPARVSYQLGSAYDLTTGVEVVVRDRRERPAPGSYSICYVNGFQAQPDEVDWWRTTHPDLLLRDAAGDLVIDKDWDEPLLDLRTPARRAEVAAVMGGWFDACASAGYAAVEADNLDSWVRSQGLLTSDDTFALAAELVQRAHRAGLAIGQKNAAELSVPARALGFDFAVAEECQVYAECGDYMASYGSRVIEVEYTDQSRSAFEEACRQHGTRIAVTRRDRDLVPAGATGHVEQWCTD